MPITYACGTGGDVKYAELLEACLSVTYGDIGPGEIRAEPYTMVKLKLKILDMSVADKTVKDQITFDGLLAMPMRFYSAVLTVDEGLPAGVYRCWVGDECYCDLIYITYEKE